MDSNQLEEAKMGLLLEKIDMSWKCHLENWFRKKNTSGLKSSKNGLVSEKSRLCIEDDIFFVKNMAGKHIIIIAFR